MMRTFLVSILLFSLSPLAWGDDFFYHGSFLWNDIRDVKVSGPYMYCAFREGVGVIDLRRDYFRKKLLTTLEVPGYPTRLHLADSLLAVETESGEIGIVRLGDSGEMALLGLVASVGEVADAAILDDFLYLGVGYDGLVRYDISDPDDYRYDDSSLAGIHVIALAVVDSFLLALDDYNGVLYYRPEAAGIGAPVAELLLPQRAVSMKIHEDTLYAGLNPNGFMVCSTADPYAAEYLGTRSSYIRADEIGFTPQGLVLSNAAAGFELIYADGPDTIDQIFPVSGKRGAGLLFAFGGDDYIVYPHSDWGLVSYIVNDPYAIDVNFPNLVYASPGPIIQIAFVNGRLHTVGRRNWYEMYDLSRPDSPLRTGKLINPPYQPVGMFSVGDTLFIADEQTNLVFPAVDPGLGDPVVVPPFFSISNRIGQPNRVPEFFEDGDLIYCRAGNFIVGANRRAGSVEVNKINWGFPSEVMSSLFSGSFLFCGLFSGGLQVYQIDTLYRKNHLLTLSAPGMVNDLAANGPYLYLAADGLWTYDISNPLQPVLLDQTALPGTINKLCLCEEMLYCAGTTGLWAFSLESNIPQYYQNGGDPATMLAVQGDIVAASDGHSVKIYSRPVLDVEESLPDHVMAPSFRLHGYPNPFNPNITLVVESPRAGGGKVIIDIYDLLGRKIRSLSGAMISGRPMEVIWDGRDADGQAVATGLYLFIAAGDGLQATYKAVLVK